MASLAERVVAAVRLLDLQKRTQSVRVLPTICLKSRKWRRVERRVIARVVGRRAPNSFRNDIYGRDGQDPALSGGREPGEALPAQALAP